MPQFVTPRRVRFCILLSAIAAVATLQGCACVLNALFSGDDDGDYGGGCHVEHHHCH